MEENKESGCLGLIVLGLASLIVLPFIVTWKLLKISYVVLASIIFGTLATIQQIFIFRR